MAYSIILCVPSYKFKVLEFTGIYLQTKNSGLISNISTIIEPHFSALNDDQTSNVFLLRFTFKTVGFNAFRIFIGFQPKMSKMAALKRNFMNGVY